MVFNEVTSMTKLMKALQIKSIEDKVLSKIKIFFYGENFEDDEKESYSVQITFLTCYQFIMFFQ